jgi:hypothetical protein
MKGSVAPLFLTKGLFIFYIVCTSLMLGIQILGTLGKDPLCCIFYTEGVDSSDHLTASIPVVLVSSLLVYGFLTAIYKAGGSHSEIIKLLAQRKKRIPQNVLRDLPDLSSIKEAIVIDVSEPFTFCFGFLRPRICLSAGLIGKLPANELKAALTHEAHHCQNFDPLRILVINVIASALFFLPVVAEWKANYELELELSADRFAIERAGKPSLAAAMRRFASFSSPRASLGSSVIVSGFSSSAARVAALLGEGFIRRQISPRSWMMSSVSIVLICALL